jgi:hypothetical protein
VEERFHQPDGRLPEHHRRQRAGRWPERIGRLLARHERWRTGDLGDAAGYRRPAGRADGGLAVSGTAFASDTTRIPVSGSSTSGIKPQDASEITRNVAGAAPVSMRA